MSRSGNIWIYCRERSRLGISSRGIPSILPFGGFDTCYRFFYNEEALGEGVRFLFSGDKDG